MSATKSLRRRIFWGFVACAAIIWGAFVVWILHTLLTDGQRSAEDEMTTYAMQILALSEGLAKQPDVTARIVQHVVNIENAPSRFDSKPDPIHVQIWYHDTLIFASANLPETRPQTGFSELNALDALWWTQTVASADASQTVRIWGLSSLTAALRLDRAPIFFLPLLFSLPVLLIPAWYMTRSGLRPLREVVTHIEQRVNNDSRAPLPPTPYEELNPIVDATNGLMQRLDAQLHRERSFAADVAHEMKTPLAIVQANADILAGYPDGQQSRQALSDLRAGITRSDRLVAQLLQLMRLERGADLPQREDLVDLAEFLRSRVGQLEPLARKRDISLVVDAPDQARVHINLTAFAAIVDNLLDNALKYGPQSAEVTVTLAQFAGRVNLRVADAGAGIPVEMRERAFERFERLREIDAEGAGLGLSIVWEAVARLRGSVSFCDAGGSAVEVGFPVRLGGNHRGAARADR